MKESTGHELMWAIKHALSVSVSTGLNDEE